MRSSVVKELSLVLLVPMYVPDRHTDRLANRLSVVIHESLSLTTPKSIHNRIGLFIGISMESENNFPFSPNPPEFKYKPRAMIIVIGDG
jgi:hypothetical protein